MIIGAFGELVFMTSDKRVMTFDGFEKTVSARYQQHDIHLHKPTLEFIGQDLTEIKFSIRLDNSLGVSPFLQTLLLEKMIKEGKKRILIVGLNYMGFFVCTKATEKLRRVDNWGTILSIDVDLELKEAK